MRDKSRATVGDYRVGQTIQLLDMRIKQIYSSFGIYLVVGDNVRHFRKLVDYSKNIFDLLASKDS